jgi:hypothetical protein
MPLPLARRFMNHCKQQISSIRRRQKQMKEGSADSKASGNKRRQNDFEGLDFCI